MHQVFAIFLRDVKRILKNPVALVVTLGVAIIPSLYAWCNILANWDPYANTGNIQVAVANEDKAQPPRWSVISTLASKPSTSLRRTISSAGVSFPSSKPSKAWNPANTMRRSYCRKTSAPD